MKYDYYFSGRKVSFYGDSPDYIFRRIIKYGEVNGLDIPTDSLLSEIKRKAYDPGLPPRRAHKGKTSSIYAREAISAATALIKNASGEMVSQEEYNRRELICRKCPLFQKTSDCFGCGAIKGISSAIEKVKAVIGGDVRTTLTDARYCGFCGCSVSVIGVTKLDNYKVSEKDNDRPSFCWLNPSSSNYELH